MKDQSSNWLPLALAEMLKTLLTERTLVPVMFSRHNGCTFPLHIRKWLKKPLERWGHTQLNGSDMGTVHLCVFREPSHMTECGEMGKTLCLQEGKAGRVNLKHVLETGNEAATGFSCGFC